MFPALYLISGFHPLSHTCTCICQRWTCECPSQEWQQKKSPRKVHSSHIIPIKGQLEVWLIPVAVNGELNNPLLLIQQHALLTMIGAMTVVFPGEALAFWWVYVSAQPCQCSAAVLVSRECIWGRGQVPGNIPSPHCSLGKHCLTGALRWAVLKHPSQTQAPGSGWCSLVVEVEKGVSCQPSPLGAN